MPFSPGASAAAAAVAGHVANFILRGRDNPRAGAARFGEMQRRTVIVTRLLVGLEPEVKTTTPKILASLERGLLRGKPLVLDHLCADVIRPFDSVLLHTLPSTYTPADARTSNQSSRGREPPSWLNIPHERDWTLDPTPFMCCHARVNSPKRVNKSKWIRSQPLTISAQELVLKGRKEGIELTAAQVYTARSTAKKAAVSTPTTEVVLVEQVQQPATVNRRGPGRPPSNGHSSTAPDLRQEFVRLILRIGTDEAAKIVASVSSQQG